MFDRKLTRRPADGPLGGVGAGLAFYFGIDAMFVYLILIGLTLLGQFYLPFVYLALWLLLPIEGRPDLEVGDRVKIGFDEMKFKARTIVDTVIDKVSKLGVSN